MKTSFAKNRTEQMPIYNRSYGQGRLSSDGDIALATHKKQIFLEREIKCDDTLQSIALEFNISASELKRANNIHKDNEIHARKVIKIPSNSFSLLLEREYFTGTENSDKQDVSQEPPEEEHNIIIETINNSSCNPRNCDKNAPEEETNSKYLFTAIKTEEQQESVSLLTTSTEPRTNRQPDVMSCNGADWGISWPTLLIVTLSLGIIGPVFWLFWLLKNNSEKPEGS